MSLDQRFADAMGQLLGPDFPTDIGLAVSGGGDSMAMLTLAHNWAHRWGVRLWVCTVDHGLRPESADEAKMVAHECTALGHGHATLRWHWDRQGNKMDAARRGRLTLINQWRGTLQHVLMAHTRDDVAETFVMRLARGSGVDGLSAMQSRRKVDIPGPVPALADFDGALPEQNAPFKGTRARPGSFHVIRPCLEMTRAELRHYLRTLQGRWVEDPSNDDPSYDRVRVRQARETLDALGLDIETLAATARRMSRARDALRGRTVEAWRKIGREGRFGSVPTGELLFDRDGFAATDRETQLRLLSAALQWIAGAEYRPRADPLEALLDRILAGGGGTLHGCEAWTERDQLRIFREFKAVEENVLGLHSNTQAVLWDARWRFRGSSGHVVRALGQDGWAQIPVKPDGAPPFRSARSLPSLWHGERLLACPALGVGDPWTLTFLPMGHEFNAFAGFLKTH